MLDELGKKIKKIEESIIELYLEENPRPWIIGFSGGKDSTLLLQIVWYTLIRRIPKERRDRRIYVVTNDTLVENPRVVDMINSTINLINKASTQQNIPIEAHKTQPELGDTFWVKLIGRGYGAPHRVFRWCTDRLKIKPATKFIKEKIKANGEVIILLGVRNDESRSRKKSIDKFKKEDTNLNKHSTLKNACIFTPIVELTTEEVWQYLTSVNPPWSGTNLNLVTLYRNAAGGECPTVIDKSTASCGKSRFGCWVCTVVNKDKSMEGLIENGEEWLECLLDVREFLLNTLKDGAKYRYDFRRNGTKKEGTFGAYLPETRYEILKRVLIAERKVKEHDPNLILISKQEIEKIQELWIKDNIIQYTVYDCIAESLK